MRRKPIKRPPYQLTDFRFNIRSYLSYSKLIILVTTLLFLLAGSYYAFFVKPDHAATVTVSAMSASMPESSLQECKASPSLCPRLQHPVGTTPLNNRWVIVILSLVLGLLVSYVLVIALD